MSGGDSPAADGWSGATFAQPRGVAVDTSTGDVYVSDAGAHVVRRLAANGSVSTYAGQSGVAGSASSTLLLNGPSGLAWAAGQLVVADEGSHRVVRVASDGSLTVLAGSGSSVHGGDGGAATAAGVPGPRSVACNSSSGVLYIATSDRRVRSVSASGVISTFAGFGGTGNGGDGGLATQANFTDITSVMLLSGVLPSLVVVDRGAYRVRRVFINTGMVSMYAGNGTGAYGGDGNVPPLMSFLDPTAMLFPTLGISQALITECAANVVRHISQFGIVGVAAGNRTDGTAGNGVVGTAASLSCPFALASDTSSSPTKVSV